jgi:tRNA pseudouridine-54 N-methylase
MEDKKVKIEDARFAYGMGITTGLLTAAEALNEMDDKLQSVPGFQLAKATIKALAEEDRALRISKNLAFLAKSGVDISRHKSVTYDPNNSEMICTFYDPDLFE